ncbi:MAG: N-acylneuraminate cytidylyltransferase [Chitinophagaceae bacterium]|nr:N-acylneuraminate cytidylyltransferase [Chitinophagaceae bacterium]
MAIAFIPARGGSKSIPGKNIKNFCGRPLLYWSILALEKSEEVTRIVVATDSPEIRHTVLGFGFEKLEVYNREEENAQDHSSTEAVMLEFLAGHTLPDDELFILAQATNPFFTTADIDQAIKQLQQQRADSLLTCVRNKRFYWKEDGTSINYDYRQRPRRQDFDGILMENGAFYINKIASIRRDHNRLSGKIAVYEMPEFTAFEIDEPSDWIIMEKLFQVNGLAGESGFGNIKLFVSDVDGVLTDAGMYYSESGDEMKKFNTHDGMGFQLLRNAGIKTGIVTTENTQIVERRAKKLKIDYLFQGKGFGGKLEVIKEMCSLENIQLNNVAYIGDDLNCLEALNAVGVKACPANAVDRVKDIPGIVHLTRRGGEGAVREFVDLLLNHIQHTSKSQDK